MSEETVVERLANKVVEHMRSHPTSTLRGAIEYILHEVYPESIRMVHDYPLWSGRFINLGGGRVIGSPAYWMKHVYPGGATYDEVFANLVKSYTAAGVERAIRTDPACADLLLHGVDDANPDGVSTDVAEAAVNQ